jgi:S-adenosylmethionine hydrolase
MTGTIISLTTDFGLKDPYVAEMKAVILGICPRATIVDISHEIEKFNVRMGGYVLACSVPYFPKGTIHVAVIDPGVGAEREAILIETEQAFFVGPNNGVLALAARKAGRVKQIRKMTSQKLMLQRVSNTFHGRDVFAPAAAHLAKGRPSAEFGPRIKEFVVPAFARVEKKEDTLVGEVVHVDGFGNIVTNFGKKESESLRIDQMVNVKIKDGKLSLKFCRTYADVEEQEPLLLLGSHDFLELSLNRGDAARAFKVETGDKIALSIGRSVD